MRRQANGEMVNSQRIVWVERCRLWMLAAVLAAGSLVCLATLFSSHRVNGGFGFPLDDPWIHLQFARNLGEFGAFSYFGSEMVTSGSTSPLYTSLLALGLALGGNEFSVSFALGVAFLLGAAGYAFRIVVAVGQPAFLGLGAAVLLVLEPRLQWAALSGMETTLFITLLLASVCHYLQRQPMAFGICAGLLLWARPEAVLLYAACGADALYHATWGQQRRDARSECRVAYSYGSMVWALSIVVVLVALYVGFNLALSGSMLPNTYAAKLAYYEGTGSGFPSAVASFLGGGSMIVVAPLALAGVWAILAAAWKRRAEPLLIALLFPVALVGAYAMKLPYLYHEGRYLMPALPFVLILAVHGIAWLCASALPPKASLRRHVFALQVGWLLAAAIVFVANGKREVYAAQCRYIAERQVAIAHWLRDNTPADAVVATHDIGAIAFYSGRKVVDMVGLVTPEMIRRAGDVDGLVENLAASGVTHVAVLRSWFPVVNQRPLVMAPASGVGEVMEVFAFDPSRTHFSSALAVRVRAAASEAVRRGELDRARQLLEPAWQEDPGDAELRYLRGVVELSAGATARAGAEFEATLRLDPDFVEARIGLAQVAAASGSVADALQRLRAIAAAYPQLAVVYRVLADVYTAHGLDAQQAAAYLARAQELERDERRRRATAP